MTRILLTLAILLTLTVTAAVAENQGDGSLLYRGTYVQGWSPNGLYTTVVSVARSATYNLTEFLAYDVYCPSDCKIRLMPTTTKGTYPQVTVLGGTWLGARVKNVATPFVNISSGSGGHEWQQQ